MCRIQIGKNDTIVLKHKRITRPVQYAVTNIQFETGWLCGMPVQLQEQHGRRDGGRRRRVRGQSFLDIKLTWL